MRQLALIIAFAVGALTGFGGCALGRAIRDATYPTFVEVEYVGGAGSTDVWLCVRESTPDKPLPGTKDLGGVPRADKFVCTDAKGFYETLVLPPGANGEDVEQL